MENVSQASFRDPAGRLVLAGDRVLRVVNPVGRPDLEAFLASPKAKSLTDAGLLVGTRVLEGSEREGLLARDGLKNLLSDPAALLIEHERVAFPSYPYEWSPEMLYEAGRVTLDLAEALLELGMGLKDATPYNILFRGPQAVFVDLLSFERRHPGDQTWLPYAQFQRTFILPLLVNKHFGIPVHQTFSVNRDGLEPEDVFRLAGPFRKLSPAFLGSVSIPTWLGRKKGTEDPKVYERKLDTDPEKAKFVLRWHFSSLRKALDRAVPSSARSSTWSDYMATFTYDDVSFKAKEAFVQAAATETKPKSALDVGCNTGHFSAIAARAGARVVSLDYDANVVGLTWRRARAEKLDILPLRVDLTRPSPGLGWRNRECPPFLERATAGGGFDLALFLAVIHHMLVTERVPLPEIIDLIADLSRNAVVEYVPPADPMFRRLARGRDALYGWLDKTSFEAAATRRFDIVRSELLDTGRILYFLRRKS